MIALKRWQRFTWLTVISLCLSLLLGCGGSPTGQPTDDGRAEVEFWTMQLQPTFQDYFDDVIATFEQNNPGIRIKWVDVPWAQMQSKILSAVSAGTAPDVVNLNPDFALQQAGQGAWLALDDKVSEAVKAQYLPKIWAASSLEGKSFGFPWYLTSPITIYNKDLLQQAGVEAVPQTYAELATVAKQVKAKTGKYAFFMTVVPEDSGELMESLVQMGVQLIDDQGKAAFNSPEGKVAFQYWVDLYQQQLLPSEAISEGHSQGVNFYSSGQTAVLRYSPTAFKNIETNAPTIAKVSVPAPQITGETGKVSVAVMNLVIPKQTDQPEAALKFAEFVTNPENQLAFAKAANVLPSTQVSLADPYFSEVPAGGTTIDQARVVSAKQMQDAEVLIPARKDIKRLQKILYTAMQEAMLNQKSVDVAIADAATEWNQSLENT